MSENEILRRASYGPTSPVVGARGSRTRALVVDTALALFGAQGFHGTSVDDIARAAGVSRATLYQYFESKEQIFIELLQECGTALLRVVRRIGPLEPTELGFDNLHWWLGEWAWVYDRYATMFVQWANLSSPGTPIPDMARRFLTEYHERIARRLAASGVTGIDPVDAAIALTTLVNAANYTRHAGPHHSASAGAGHGTSDATGRGGPAAAGHGDARAAARPGPISPDQMTDSLAVIIQLMLFPQTPPGAFTQLDREIPSPRPPSTGERRWSAPASSTSTPAARPTTVPGAVAELVPVAPPDDRFAGLSARAAATVGRLLEAGVLCFTEKGYHQCSVDDVVSLAGYARGTFYKYFDEKLDLLVALSDRAVGTIAGLDDRLRRIDVASADGPSELRDWLTDVVAFHLGHLGIVRVWPDQQPRHPRLDAVRQILGERLHSGHARLVGPGRWPYPLDPRVASVAFFAVLEQLPEALTTVDPNRPTERVVDLVAAVLDRTRLCPTGEPPAGPARGTGRHSDGSPRSH